MVASRIQTRNWKKGYQFAVCTGLVFISAAFCFLLKDFTGYRSVAVILLMVVSVIATLFEIGPVLTAAVLSACIWNFFFIPPILTFHIGTTEDTLFFFMYFTVVLVHASLTFQIRKAEEKARKEEEKETTIRLFNTVLNSLSHEIRTPVSMIISSVDLLKSPEQMLPEADRQELLAEIEKASDRLNRQVGNLLDMSRLESGFLVPKPDWTDIAEVLDSIQIRLPVHLKKIRVDLPEKMPLVYVDAGLLETAVYNIVLNAVNHAPDHTLVILSVEYDELNLHIRVSDEGPGIPEKYRTEIFGKFIRVPGSKTGGVGLGLSVVKGICEALGGYVEMGGKSSEFHISVPCKFSFINRLNHE